MMSAGGGGKRDNNIIFYLDSVGDFMGEPVYTYSVKAEYPVSSRVFVSITFFNEYIGEGDRVDYVIKVGDTIGYSTVVGHMHPIYYYAMEVSPAEDSKYRYIANGNW